MIRPYISEQYRNEEQKREFLDAQINGEQQFLKGCLLNNGTIVFRTVDINGNQTEKLGKINSDDVINYRENIHPGLVVVQPSEEASINDFYLVQPAIRVGQKTLFINGQLIIYKDEWTSNPGQFFTFSLANSKEIICPKENITGSLSFFLNNEGVINEQRHQFDNNIRFNLLDKTFESSKESLPSLQEIEEKHQLIING